MNASDILKTAESIVNGDRRRDYGHPRDNHGCTAALWRAYLLRRGNALEAGGCVSVDAYDVCMLNILQKISRAANRRTDDTLVDIVGYALNAAMVQDATLTGGKNRQKETNELVGDTNRDYCLMCRREITTESGHVCTSCANAVVSGSVPLAETKEKR